MDNLLFFTINTLILALSLALFEIIIEKGSGWGSGWQKNKWYARQFAPANFLVKFFSGLIRISAPLYYHLLIFIVVLPLIFIVEYFTLTQNIFLLLSCFIGVIVCEDFLWFLLNWNFDSLSQLLKGPNGTIWWHLSWTKISRDKYLPTTYFTGLALTLIFLLLSHFC